jgi:hypothetical protein
VSNKDLKNIWTLRVEKHMNFVMCPLFFPPKKPRNPMIIEKIIFQGQKELV